MGSLHVTKRTNSESNQKNGNGFFWLPRVWFTSGKWAELPRAAKAVLPVALSHQFGPDNWAFPSEKTVATFAGVSVKTARVGMYAMLRADLENMEGVSFKSCPGRTCKQFHYVRGDDEFPFSNFIIFGGYWRELNRSAQSLFPALLSVARFDQDLYQESGFDVDNLFYGHWDECQDNFPRRHYDFIDINAYGIGELVGIAGISRRSFWTAINSLVELGFVRILPNNLLAVSAVHYWTLRSNYREIIAGVMGNNCLLIR